MKSLRAESRKGAHENRAPMGPEILSSTEFGSYAFPALASPGISNHGLETVGWRDATLLDIKEHSRGDSSLDSQGGQLQLTRVQSRSRTRLRIAASIAFLFRACFKCV